MQARRLPARHGAFWLWAGFGLLRRNPPLMISLTLAYWLLFALMLQAQPLLASIALPLLLPIITLILANGARAVAEGRSRPPPPGTLTTGVRGANRALLRLCGLNLLASALVMAVSPWLLGDGFAAAQAAADSDNADQASLQLLIVMLELALLTSPLLLAFWFSPLLSGWDGVPAGKALFFSLIACLRNWRAFAVYGLAALGLAVVLPSLVVSLVASLAPGLAPLLFGALRAVFLLALAPALMAGVYLGYRDIFVHEGHD